MEIKINEHGFELIPGEHLEEQILQLLYDKHGKDTMVVKYHISKHENISKFAGREPNILEFLTTKSTYEMKKDDKD